MAGFLGACASPERPNPFIADAPAGLGNAGGAATTNVFVIVMENKAWSTVKGRASAPYINGTILPAAASADNYLNPLPAPGPHLHPSLSNYLWIEAGDDFGVRFSPEPGGPPARNGQTGKDHLVKRLGAAGISWKVWAEGIAATGCPVDDLARQPTRHVDARRHPAAVTRLPSRT